ncbi:extracellular solute-binding protein [Fodinicola feengrottensis]|uniref:Extracellular solute-binding protein n=1 Tax=Fodinicola feengrottensis TaxID=435914 RepID=A0ABN2GKJ8_9ACTN
MRKLRRPLGLAVAALAVAASLAPSLAACGSGASSDGTTTLHVVGWKGGGAEPANVAQINAAFQKSHPKIKLDFSYVPPNDVYQQKIQSQLLAGNAADVVMVDPQKVQIWGKSGYFADLGQRSWAASISPAVKSFVSYQDKVLASPMELSPVGVYVNLDILAKAGVTAPPTDFPAFLAALGKLKAAGQPGYSFPDAQGYMAEFVMLMSAATTVYQDNPNWDQQFLQGKVTFPQSFREPLQQIQQLGTNGYVDFKNAVGTDEATTGQPDFLAGKSAFFAGGSWSAAALKKAPFKLAFVPWPGGKVGVKPSALLFPGTMWAVNARSSQQDAAKQYVDFWSSSQNLAPYLSAEVAISPFGASTAGADPLLATMADAYATKRFALFPTNTWNLAAPETKIRSILQNFLLGKADVTATLTAIQNAAKPANS